MSEPEKLPKKIDELKQLNSWATPPQEKSLVDFLYALEVQARQAPSPAAELLQAELLKIALVEFCQRTKMEESLWKSLVS